MKNTKKIIALALTVVLCLSMFTGCKKDQKAAGGVKVYDAFIFMPNVAYNADMPVWKEAEKATGVRLNGVVSEVATDPQAAYSTMLAGSELPAVIRTTCKNLSELAADGGLVPLDDLIEEYAPNLKKYFEDYPMAKAVATGEDGHIYFVSCMLGETESRPSVGHFVRKDWLEKLGLEEPKTIDELHDVLYAFRNEDPNGNGKKDEIPYFARDKSVNGILRLFNADLDILVKNGKIVYSPATPEFKEGVKTIAKWYKEGLIDPEIFSRTNPREQLLGSDIGGYTVDWFASTASFNDVFKDSVPGIDFSAILPPESTDGKVKMINSFNCLTDNAWGITSNTSEEDQIELIKYFDFWLTEEGINLQTWGVEGMSYEYDKNGEIVFTEEALKYPGGFPEYKASIGANHIPTITLNKAEKMAMNEAARKGFEMYEPLVGAPLPRLSYTSEESEILAKYENNVKTAFGEQYMKWVMGKGDVDKEWDAYIDTLNSLGLKEILKVYNSAYDRLYK